MTICNVCGAELWTKDPSAFLCLAHERLVPDELLAIYQGAARAIRQHHAYQMKRRRRGQVIQPLPRDLFDEAVEAWHACREAAITAHSEMEAA